MAKRRQIGIRFPLGGLNRRGAYRQQAPFSSPGMLNVRPESTIEGRERGGSRPGLVQSHRDDLVSPVRLLSPMVLALGDNFTSWSDTFSGSSLAAAWTQASWASASPSVLPSALASIDDSVSDAAVVRDALSIDTSETYTVEMFLSPWDGAWHGTYRLYLRLDNTTPDIDADGVVVELTQTGTTGAYTASLKSYSGAAETEVDTDSGTIAVQPGWLSATVSGTTVTVYWQNTQILTGTVDAHTGSRVGFGLECTVDGGLCLVNVFRAQYYSTSEITGSRSILVASAGGSLYRETSYGRMEAVSTSLTLNSDQALSAAQSGQKLYIADYSAARATGTDGTVSGTSFDSATYSDWTTLGIDADDDVVVISNVGGSTVAGTYKIDSVAAGSITLSSAPGDGTCSFRIERAPKIYDPSAGTLSIWTATAGQVPSGCPLIARHLDRLYLAGADVAPHVWYASRSGTETDFDYSQTDSARAVAGTASDAGVPGTAILALVPHSDDYLILGCRDSLWRLRGDPAYGGTLDSLSRTVGIIGKDAWCLGPDGELIFLSLNGLYAVAPGGNSFPIPLSQEILPREFRNIDPGQVTASLEYDAQDRGIHVFLTPDSSNERIHWWLDWDNKTFWPVSLSSDHEPTAACAYQGTAIEDSGVILGGRDGKLRRFSELAANDCGTAYTNYVIIGPIGLAPDAYVGRVMSMDAVLADGSGSVTWTVHPALTFEGSYSASASDTGSWTEGINATVRPACRGQAFTLKLTGAASRRWAVEQIVATIETVGARRIT